MNTKFIENSDNLELIDDSIEMLDVILENVEPEEMEGKHVTVDCAHYFDLVTLLLDMLVEYEDFDADDHMKLVQLRKSYPGTQFGSHIKH